MDKIKGFINDLTGGDGKVDANDIQNAAGDVNMDNLMEKAEGLGLGDLGGKLEQFGISGSDLEVLSKINFPVDKAEIVSALKTAGVSDSLTSLVEKVPDGIIESLNDLRDKLPI